VLGSHMVGRAFLPDLNDGPQNKNLGDDG
jgi:hypothetical protein